MNGDMILARPVAVQGWRVIGQVAKAEKREELAPILERARENDGTNANDLAHHLLFSHSRKVVAERLLRIGDRYGLLEKRGRDHFVLTEDGKRAVETEEVFVPEHGAWTMWTSDDPLLSSPVLGIEPWDEEPSAFDEGRKRRENGEREFEPLPDWIRAACGSEISPPTSKDRAVVRIEDLDEEAEVVKVDASLQLIWNVRERRLRLRGKLNQREVDADLLPPRKTTEYVWSALLEGEGLLVGWKPDIPALAIPFRETSERERATMRRDLVFEKPSVPEHGSFDSLTVPGVPITAGSRDDAREWSEWRLKARVGDYATSRRYADWSGEAAEPFAKYRPELPDRAALAERAWRLAAGRPGPEAWYLVAAEDWGL